jgi:hypothetical protein
MSLTTRALTIASLGSAVVAGSLLHPVVSGQVTHTTHMGGPIGEGLLPTAGVFVAVALLLGLVAYHEHIPTVNRVVSSRTTKRVGTFVLVGAIVSAAAISGVGGPASPVGTVEAGYFEGCEISDSLTLAVGASLGLSNQDCAVYTPDYDTSNLTATQSYSSGLSTQDTGDTFVTSMQNFENDRRSVAWAKAKIEIVNALNSNETNATAKADAKAAVENYYATAQKNIVADYNARARWAEFHANASGNVIITQNDGGTYNLDGTQPEGNISLVNGNNTTTVYLGYDNGGNHHHFADSGDAYDTPSPYSPVGDGETNEVYVTDPDSSNTAQIIYFEEYHKLFYDLETQNSQIAANIDTYVDDVYAAYNAGEINATDLVSADPSVLSAEASTQYNSTGYYGFANAQLAALGLSGNNTVSHVVNTTDNGSARTVTGTVYYTGEDSQTFDTGTEYDPSNLTGEVYMSVSSIEDGTGTDLNSSSGFYHVTENFTITEATNTKTGEAVNTTSMETRDYTTTNATALQEEIDRLKEQQAYYEEQLDASSGGVSFDFGGVETGVILALLAVAFLATRD